MYKISKAMPHNSKCRYGERGAAATKPKAQIILDAAKVSAASGGCSEPKQGQRSQSARGSCPRSTMRVPQPDIIEHFGNADAVPQPPERCLSRKAGIMRCCLKCNPKIKTEYTKKICPFPRIIPGKQADIIILWDNSVYIAITAWRRSINFTPCPPSYHRLCTDRRSSCKPQGRLRGRSA